MGRRTPGDDSDVCRSVTVGVNTWNGSMASCFPAVRATSIPRSMARRHTRAWARWFLIAMSWTLPCWSIPSKAALPVLGICFGAQSLNVFRGGTLIQDIPSIVAAPVFHDDHGEPQQPARHPVRLERRQSSGTAGGHGGGRSKQFSSPVRRARGSEPSGRCDGAGRGCRSD